MKKPKKNQAKLDKETQLLAEFIDKNQPEKPAPFDMSRCLKRNDDGTFEIDVEALKKERDRAYPQ